MPVASCIASSTPVTANNPLSPVLSLKLSMVNVPDFDRASAREAARSPWESPANARNLSVPGEAG